MISGWSHPEKSRDRRALFLTGSIVSSGAKKCCGRSLSLFPGISGYSSSFSFCLDLILVSKALRASDICSAGNTLLNFGIQWIRLIDFRPALLFFITNFERPFFSGLSCVMSSSDGGDIWWNLYVVGLPGFLFISLTVLRAVPLVNTNYPSIPL